VLVGLRLENIALIDCLELSFQKGFTAFTGQTGAGKSIFLDSIDLLLGGGKNSSNKNLIYKGKTNAFIEGCFLKNAAIEDWLCKNQFEIESDEFFLSRDWKLKDERWLTRYRLNGLIINKQQVLSLRPCLIDFTVQGQTHNLYLLNDSSKWLDKYGFKAIKDTLENVKLSWDEWSGINKKISQIKKRNQEYKNQLEEFNQFLEDLDKAKIDDPMEDIKLQQEQDKLVYGVKLQEGLEKIFLYLKNSEANIPSVFENLEIIIRELKTMSNLDSSLSSHLDFAMNLYADVDKLKNLLEEYSFTLESNPFRLHEIQERILLLKRIQNRYSLNLKELIIRREEYQNFILSNSNTSDLEKLESQEVLFRNQRDKNNSLLTNLRKQIANNFESVLMKYLRKLGLENVQFKVQILPSKPSANGADNISFLFSANPGQPLAPLSQAASGGEMSRFLLALKTTLAAVDGTSTLIFDEIDTGVSGRISSSIAKLLKELSIQKQVFCVTHQPLVAAIADHHFSVSKSVKDGSTSSTVTLLTDFESRKGELAELAGGDFEEAIIYAASLLGNKAA